MTLQVPCSLRKWDTYDHFVQGFPKILENMIEGFYDLPHGIYLCTVLVKSFVHLNVIFFSSLPGGDM